MPKVKVPETPKEILHLAKRYLRNAKELLKNAGLNKEVNSYIDIKHVSIASGTAYLAVLEAMKALIMVRKFWDITEVEKNAKEISSYRKILKTLPLGKDKDVILDLLLDVYNILHLGGYYRKLRDEKSIDSGFEKVERIIEIVEKHINEQP